MAPNMGSSLTLIHKKSSIKVCYTVDNFAASLDSISNGICFILIILIFIQNVFSISVEGTFKCSLKTQWRLGSTPSNSNNTHWLLSKQTYAPLVFLLVHWQIRNSRNSMTSVCWPARCPDWLNDIFEQPYWLWVASSVSVYSINPLPWSQQT